MKKNIAATLLLTTVGGQLLQAAPESSDSKLDETTILTNRTPTNLNKVGSSVTILDAQELEKSGTFYIDEALQFVPGAISESTGGQRGSISSIFLRGTSTRHAHIRVDGMRLSGANILSGGFLGQAGLSGLSRIEVLRGPQSAVYGGDSIGGVIGLYSQRGTGTPSGSFRLEAGSHATYNTSLSFQGEINRLSYAFGVGYLETENDLPNNDYKQFNQSLRLDYQVNDALDIGLTLRAFQSEFRRPDYTDPTFARDGNDTTDSTLATIYAALQVNETWASKLTIGAYWEDFFSDTFGSINYFETDGEKFAVYWDNTITWNDRHTSTVGAVYEKTDYYYASEFFGLSEDNRDLTQYGIYAQHRWDITDALTLNGGIRWEDYDSYGDEFTWRSSAAYKIPFSGTKLRASYGTAFRPPSFQQLFGFGGGSNFSLQAESSTGWDAGIDQEFLDGTYTISATWFENRISDFIRSSFGPPPFFITTNFNAPGTTTTRGLELSATGNWLDERLKAIVNYTWLDETLDGQPEHSIGIRLNAQLSDKLDTGISIIYRDDRTFGGNNLNSYSVTNLHANYRVSENVTINARLENIFDKEYELASFGSGTSRSTFPGKGRGIFGGLTLEW